MEFKKTLKLEQSDFAAYNIFTMKRLFIIIPIVSVCILFLFREDSETDLLGSIIYAVITTVLTALGFFALIKYSSKKSFKSTKAAQLPQEITLNDMGVFSSGEYGNTNMPWQDIYKVVEVKKAFYVYLLKMQALVIPKRLTSAEENAVIRSIVKQNLSSNKYRLREQ